MKNCFPLSRNVKMVMAVAKKTSEPILAFSQLGPLYISPDLKTGAKECNTFFPPPEPGAEEEEEEEEIVDEEEDEEDEGGEEEDEDEEEGEEEGQEEGGEEEEEEEIDFTTYMADIEISEHSVSQLTDNAENEDATEDALNANVESNEEG